MINGLQSWYTITSGLILQQLEQEVNASNISNPSLDANGYLMNSLERINTATGLPLASSGPNGFFQVETGPEVQSITRLRSSFLDTQIQQESTILGRAEVLANSSGTGILNLIQPIVAGSSTLNGALNNFAAAWSALGSNADPATDTTDRAAVVNTGIAFAKLANGQFQQLESLQASNGQQIQTTVSQINDILHQLNTINNQLLNSQGTNQNSLLDARDYALDRLARLVNIQTNFGAAGTVNVYLGSSSLTLVDSSGAAIFQTTPINTHYPDYVGITIQSPEGGIYGAGGRAPNATANDIESLITGGNLGGELQGQYTILSYQEQVDQIATSVMFVTNRLHESGYAVDGATTGNDFFTGTGAADIGVNPVLISNNQLVAAAISPSAGPDTNGQIAQFLGNLPNILANNYVQSNNWVSNAPGIIDPSNTLAFDNTAGAGGTSLFAAAPVGPGQFTVNGVTITWDTTDSIDSILNKINSSVPNVYAVYDTSKSLFYMFSNKPINIVNQTGNFTTWGNISNFLVSTIRMNNYEAANMPLIDPGGFGGIPAAAPLNSTVLNNVPFQEPTGPNSIAFKVVPSTSGLFTINGNTFLWNNNMSLQQIGNLINVPPPSVTLPGPVPQTVITNPFPAWTGTSNITFNFNVPSIPPGPLNLPDETVALYSNQNGANSPQPIQIADISGNFSTFTGLNGSVPLGNMAQGLSGQISTDVASQQLLESQASSSLDQLNAAQANIAGVSTTGSQPGVPIAVIQQQAVQSMISYNAMLQVLQIIDQMYADLLNMVGASTTANTSFQQMKV